MSADQGWLLALDLSCPEGILVLEGPGGLFHRAIEGGSRVSRLFTAADEALSSAGITPEDVGLIGVARGPGSFTGVRVAVMAAKALAEVLKSPLVAPDSLEVMAAGAGGLAEAVLVVMDARRGEVYHALYRLENGHPVALHGPSVASPEEVAESLSGWRDEFPVRIGIMGTGVDAFPSAWPRDLLVIPGECPTPQGLIHLCRRREAKGDTCHVLQLLPLYIRRPDARERFDCGRGR